VRELAISSLLVALTLGGIIAAVLVYLLPAVVAHRRRHPQANAITVLNVFAGWTLFGWVGALVWASASAGPLLPMREPTRPAAPDDDPPVYEIPEPPRRKR
jgi:cell division protein FtsX